MLQLETIDPRILGQRLAEAAQGEGRHAGRGGQLSHLQPSDLYRDRERADALLSRKRSLSWPRISVAGCRNWFGPVNRSLTFSHTFAPWRSG